MKIPDLLLSSRIISDAPIQDFDIVVVDRRPVVVCVDPRGQQAFTWDPADDHWAVHPLDNPFGPDEDESDGLLKIGAVVLDGRIVVGGGGYRQAFAQWDLETGAVRTYIRDEHGGLARTSTMDLGGRPLFICGDSSVPAKVRLWDASQRDSLTEYEEEDEKWFEVDYRAEPIDLDTRGERGHFDGIGGLSSGTLGGHPVVISGGVDGRVMLWNIHSKELLVQFERAPVPIMGVGLATVDGRVRVVAAGGKSVLLSDPGTGTWDERIDIGNDRDDEGIHCMDVGVVDGRPVAVTGAEDGTVRVWDLQGRRLLGDPLTEHKQEVFAVRVTELGGRTVAVTAGQDCQMRVWNLGQR
jgi:WD40 repeat protein